MLKGTHCALCGKGAKEVILIKDYLVLTCGRHSKTACEKKINERVGKNGHCQNCKKD